jgi:hypothetical protein
MLQDQENIEDFSDEVSVPFDANYEVMKASAWRVCRQTFETDALTEIVDVQQRTKTPNQSGNVKWICKIRAERRMADGGDQN